MLTDERTLRPGLYPLPDVRVARNILIPGFRAATTVRGAFGWFTAGWIRQLAPGLAVYLDRDDTEPMEFTVAPALFPAERGAVERGAQMTEEEAARFVADVFIKGRAAAGPLARHALDCLSWMIATDALRLRIAVPTHESNYHPKLWLFDDGENQVLARGSGNATGRGVGAGVEHLDVDVSWQNDSRVPAGMTMLNNWSTGHSPGIAKVFDLPEAVARDIIETAPEQAPRPSEYDVLAIRNRTVFPRRSVPRPPHRLRIPDCLEWRSGRYAHQGDAVEGWEQVEPPERGVIAMATGAGKTLTALICASRCQDRLGNGNQPFLIVVSAPSVPLIMQWAEEVRKFGVSPVTPTLGSKANTRLTSLFRGLRGGGTHVAIVTNNMLCDPSFQETVKHKLQTRSGAIPTLLIADEAHTLGAESFIRNKPSFFERRLGLSATPERQYDPDGTEEIFEFFGPAVYEFGLDRAIGFCLVPYRYYVHACTLNGDELAEFEALSRRIGATMAGESDAGEDSPLRALLIARRRIIETADSKLDLLRAVLERRRPRDLAHALIYASAKNPEQFDRIGSLLSELEVKWAPVTQETTRNPKRLAQILDSFGKGAIQVLLAKKVLDEGVDIPTIREAFIVASSTVEREWVQRRGRVLRMHPGKPWAIVHDFLALPPAGWFRRDRTPSIAGIVRTECGRAQAFGRYAQNIVGHDGLDADLSQLSETFWPRSSAVASQLDNPGDLRVARATPGGKLW
ncbi:MAG: DEAD/DEAH box helicase family protein [Gammaproteobacteria bacterium]|nr:DEAD/DEAH box helicase family protein [Gammaproteobacteria bacterium]